MSPSSAGVKPVPTNGIEQYIGSYLISTSARPKFNQKGKNFPKTDNKPRPNQPVRSYNDGWAGGAPLYSMPNYPRKQEVFHQQTQLSRLAMHTHGVPLILTGKNARKHNYPQKCNDYRYAKPDYPKVINQELSCVIDTLSVTSDESSGSTNSESCLPRIIKPRKRRKKDRKPAAVATVVESEETVKSDVPDVPNLNHDFEDVKEVQNHCSPTSCQCKLCDPSGQIWNIDLSYKPFSSDVDKMVRRSWSDPSSNYTHQDNPSVGVIGQGRQSQEWKESTSSPNIHYSNFQSSLNISSEIVTSPNGHRDLEIKFLSFSCSSDNKNDSFFSNNVVTKSRNDDSRQSCFNSEE